MQFLIGFVFFAVGAFEIWKTDWLIRNFGYIDWAEQKIGSGGTWTFHKIVGVLLILLGFMIGSGQITGVLDWLFIR